MHEKQYNSQKKSAIFQAPSNTETQVPSQCLLMLGKRSMLFTLLGFILFYKCAVPK